MPYISVPCGQKNHFVRQITIGTLHFVVVLSLLSVTAVSEAAHDPRQLMDSIEFFQDDTLEATIDIVTALGYRPRDGLSISFAGASIGEFQRPIVTGDATTGYIVTLNANITSIPYDFIAQALQYQIDELSSATLRTVVVGSEYNPFLQDFPPTTVLFVEAAVPEPSSIVMIAILCVTLCAGRRRRRLNNLFM